MSALLLAAGIGLTLAALAYASLALWCLMARDRAPTASAWQPGVTVLKPLYGDEPDLEGALRGFFELDYPAYQLVFGVQGADDAALAVVRRLMAEFPACDAALVVDARAHGTNPKVSNLINMMAAARHAVLVLSDSDIWVGPDYLAAVVAPLADPAIGAVTCLYRARRVVPGLANRLAAQHIDDGFLPSVLVARRLGQRGFCLGSTIALRREALAGIGGFEALSDALADDYQIGARLAQRGLVVALSPYLVETTVAEPSFRALLAHELRWSRTVRAVEPQGYALSFLTFTISTCALGGALLLFAGSVLGAALALASGLLARATLYLAQNRRLRRGLGDLWLLPLRDLLSFAVWLASFGGRTIVWRGVRFEVDGEGRLKAAKGESRASDARWSRARSASKRSPP